MPGPTKHLKEQTKTEFRAEEGGACTQGLQILPKNTARLPLPSSRKSKTLGDSSTEFSKEEIISEPEQSPARGLWGQWVRGESTETRVGRDVLLLSYFARFYVTKTALGSYTSS